MKRNRQSVEELLQFISPVETDWKDEHSRRVLAVLSTFPVKAEYNLDDLRDLLVQDVESGLTVLRLFLDQSKDAFLANLRNVLGLGGFGRKRLIYEYGTRVRSEVA